MTTVSGTEALGFLLRTEVEFNPVAIGVCGANRRRLLYISLTDVRISGGIVGFCISRFQSRYCGFV